MSTATTDALHHDPSSLCAYLDKAWPDAPVPFDPHLIEHLEPGHLRLRRPQRLLATRPGGTVGGPSLMQLADGAAFVLIVAHLGEAALAVTSQLSINFLRRATPGDLAAETRLLKLGRTTAVVEVAIEEADQPDPPPVAVSLVTYSLVLTGQ